MRYFESYAFPFRSRNWAANILICLVAAFVPVAGQMVILGYQFEILQALHLRGTEKYPDFDMNRLLPYLIRGAWVFLVLLIVVLPVLVVVALILVASLVGLTALAQEAGEDYGPFIVVGGAAALYTVLLFVNVLVYTAALPMALRAGLTQEFGAAFDWGFVRDFIGRVGGKTVLAELFFILTTVVATFAGLLVFCVGAYFAAAWVAFVRTYLWYELYELYLQRGGMEIPLAAEAPPRPRVHYDED